MDFFVWHMAGAREHWDNYEGNGSELCYQYGDGMGYGYMTGEMLGGGQYWSYKADEWGYSKSGNGGYIYYY